uniref:Uncharacterized protein n=1 Tax=Eptatretus burgeri TaxID=7764 RepID=A0A8C4WU06_EPTBU
MERKELGEWNKHDERLLQAVEGQDAERVATAIQKKGASPSKLDGEGRSAFHVAAAKGHEGCLSVILEHSIDTSITDASGKIKNRKKNESVCTIILPFMILLFNQFISSVDIFFYFLPAAIQGDLTTVQMLSNHKSPVNGKDNDGSSPLALAARMCHPDICNYLMDRGADINIRDNHKKTPLMVACEHGSRAAVEALLTKGADVRASDVRGHNALHYAKQSNHAATLVLIQEEAGGSGSVSPSCPSPIEGKLKSSQQDNQLWRVILLGTYSLRVYFERVQQRARDYDGKMRRLQQQLRLLPLGRDASQTELSSPETACNQLLQLKSAARADGAGIGDTESISYPINLSIEEGTKEELQQSYEQQLCEARAELSAEWAARQEAEWRAEEVKQMYERRIEDIEHKVATSRTLQQGVEGQMEKVKLSYERQARELDSQLNSARAAHERERKHVSELQIKLEEAQQTLAHSVPLRQYEELETSFNLSLEETSERLAGLTEQYNVAQDEIARLQADNLNKSISRVPHADRVDIEEQLRNALDTREVEALELTTRYAEVKDRRRELSAALESLQLELKSVSNRLTESEKLRVVLKVDLDTVRREFADVSHRHSGVEKENEFLKSALKESKQELKNVLTLYEDLQKDVSFKNEHIKTLEMMVSDVTDKLSLVQEEMRLMQSKTENLEYSQMQMVPKEIVEKESVMLQEEAAMLKNMMSEMSQSCLKVETEKQELEGLLLKAKEKLSDLENENKVAQGEVNRTNLTLAAVQAECNEKVSRHKHEEIVSLLKEEEEVSEVQEERARLRLALNSLSQLPYATGSTKRQNQQLEGLHIQLRKVQHQLLEAEKRHQEVVAVYRTHLLCAVQAST